MNFSLDIDGAVPSKKGKPTEKSIAEIEEQLSCEPSNFLQASAASDSDLNLLEDSSLCKQSKFPQALEPYTPNTSQIHRSGTMCEPSREDQGTSIASLEEARAKTSQVVEKSGELTESALVCGGKCSESLMSADPVSLAGRTYAERLTEELEKWLPASEWSDIKSKAHLCYRLRNSERRTKESASFLLDTPTTYPKSLKGQAEAGRNKLESKLRLPATISIPTPRSNDGMQGYNTGKTGGANLTGYLKLATPAARDSKGISPTSKIGASATLPDNVQPFLLPTESANPQVWGWMMGFPTNWCEAVLMPPGFWEPISLDGGNIIPLPAELESMASASKAGAIASTTTEQPASPPKLSPSPSELNICGNSFITSGLSISFGKTLQYLPHKTATRRTWKDTHAKKFINAFHQNKLVKVLDKDIRYGGKQIGWCRLLCVPYKEQLSAMPDGDLAAEGGMCSSVEEFVAQYFKGNSNLEVWVIRFEFITDLEVLDLEPAAVLGVCANSQSTIDSNYPISSPIESIHQTPLTVLGVYSDSDNVANNNPSNSLPIESIHQASSAEFPTNPGVYPIPETHKPQELAVTQGATAESKGQSTKKNTDCWYTPPEIVELVLQALGWIDLDPCADNHKHVPAKAHYTEADDGLARKWTGKVFINPHYSCPGKWIAKLQAEFDSGRVTEAIALVPAATDTKWLSPLLNTQAICFWKGRIKFLDIDYQPKLPARQSHVLVYWGAEPAKFKQVFQKHGAVFIPEVAPCLPSIDEDAIETGDRFNTNPAIPSPIKSIHQAPSIDFGVYSNFASTTDSNYPISSPIDNIPQAANESRGICFGAGDRFDTNPAIPSPIESIHQTPVVQGGNGLVYTFWKGESLVNHYRYKVKVNGKWKVKSVYIPVGKLPKVREAIANNLGVALIVKQILNKHL